MRRFATMASITALMALGACNSGEAPTEEAEPTEEIGEAPEAEAAPVQASPAAATTSAAPPAEIDGVENRRVSFDAGANSATVEGSITGYESIDYLLNVREGQLLNVSMATQNTATYFNVLEPGETDVAIHIGSTIGSQYEGVAGESGDYRIRVYMMRSAARRDETADYRLEMIVE